VAGVLSLFLVLSPPSPAEVAQGYAWAAWNAAEAGRTEAVPELLVLLDRSAALGGAEGGWARSSLLDALIRLDAAPKWERLEPLLANDRTAVLLLTARRPRVYREGLLACMDRGFGWEWIAACNLLTRLKAPGLAGRLLDGLPVGLTLRVVDAGTGPRGCIGIGGGAGGRGCGRVLVQPGWPPRVFYTLTDRPAEGSRLVAPGPVPVYVRRTVIVDRGGIGGATAWPWRQPQLRYEALAALLDTHVDQLPLHRESHREIFWNGAVRYATAVAAARASVERDFADLVARLRVRGLLTAAEARGLAPAIETGVRDLRGDKSVPLPAGS